jgi:signal transduction histidine kinase
MKVTIGKKIFFGYLIIMLLAAVLAAYLINRVPRADIVVPLVLVVVGSIIAGFISKVITRHVKELIVKTKKVSEGFFDQEIEVKSKDEIGDLAKSFNQLVQIHKNAERVFQDYRSKLEEQQWGLEKTNEAIKLLYKELDKKNQELQKLNQMKNDFVSNVSHEFRNPLAIAQDSLSIVLEGAVGELEEKQEHLLSLTKKSIDRLLRLVIDMLDISKIEAGKMEMKKKKVAIAPLVNEVLDINERELSKKKISLKRDVPKNIGSFSVDRDKMSEVIINLLSNAIKYTPEEGQISVKLQGDKKEVRFEISDSGKGIPPENRQKIFDKFERIISEKEEGTGLGLPITKDIVELHKGKIWVESEPEKGSKFIFVVPR